MNMISITIPGKPIAQARPRFCSRGKHVGTYNPQESEAGKFWLQVKAQLPADWKPIEGPARLDVVFILPIPKSAPKRAKASMAALEIAPTGRPDLDNYVKFVADACKGLLWLDDSQIVRLDACKCFGEAPGTHIRVTPLECTGSNDKTRKIASEVP